MAPCLGRHFQYIFPCYNVCMKSIKQIHNKLRQKYLWYRTWHNFEYATYFHIFALFVVALTIFSLALSQTKLVFLDEQKVSFSATGSDALTTQAEWQAGIYDMGTDLVDAPGDVKLFAETQIDPSIGSWSTDGIGDITGLYDGNTATGVSLIGANYILRDFGQTISNVTKYRIFYTNGPGWDVVPGLCGKAKKEYALSCGDIDGDGIEWTNYAIFGNTNMTQDVWNDKSIAPSTTSKFRLVADDTYKVTEFEFYFQPLTATHTSTSSQIGATGDAQRYVAEYQLFTPTESEPANSDITYRFRLTTSDGGSTGTWTDYIDYTGTAIDLTAQSALAITQTEIDAGKTYLQVETKFVRVDVSANPTLSDYTASYHTNKAPTAPTAL